ncbi:MAG: hypothetical protein IKB21_04170, partial [Clostridia bacterium]|nr:hypothetical protein [Clostridia bacterium]
KQITESDLATIQKEMINIIQKGEKFERAVLSRKDALEMFKGNEYKTELITELAEDAEISTYTLGADFVDLCAGPHVEHAGKLQNMGFKVAKVNGAYWRGDEKNKMLQRVYVYAFNTKEELNDYLKFLEEAQKRDHRKLGKELGLFMISDYAKGMPFYLPNGLTVKNELIKFWKEKHQAAGYIEIETPMAMNRTLWETSGHWEHYQENMYTFDVEGEQFAIKPMNCPGGMLFYKEGIHSYKEFPLRVAELGKVHRHEASGTLHGLFRVRVFTQDDAHIFMLPSQIESEVKNVLDLVDELYAVFGFNYSFELSLCLKAILVRLKLGALPKPHLKMRLNLRVRIIKLMRAMARSMGQKLTSKSKMPLAEAGNAEQSSLICNFQAALTLNMLMKTASARNLL